MALDGLGEKLKNFFKSKDDPRFKGQGRRLGTGEAHASSRSHQPQPPVNGGHAANPNLAPDTNGYAEAPSGLKPPPQPLGSGGRPAPVVSRSHRTEDVVLDAAVMVANTPTGREANLVAGNKLPGCGGTPTHLGSGPGSPLSHPSSLPHAPSRFSPSAASGAGTVGDGSGVAASSGLTVEVQSASGRGRGGPAGATGGDGGATHAGGAAGRGRSRSRGTPDGLNTMVSTISTPTAAERRMGGFRCPAPPTDGAMADYGLAPATSQAYELQRCLALVLSSRPLSNSNLSTSDLSAAAAATASTASPAASSLASSVSPYPAPPLLAAELPSPSKAALEEAVAGANVDPLATTSTSSKSLTTTSTTAAAAVGAAPAPDGVAAGARTSFAAAAAPDARQSNGDHGGAGGCGGGGGGAAGPRECCDALLRVLRNVMTRPEEQKFRHIRLSNPRVQETIVGLPGAVEFLEAAGFQMRFSPDDGSNTANQGYLILPEEVPPSALAEPFRILSAAMAAHGLSTSTTTSAPAAAPAAAVAAPPAPPPMRPQPATAPAASAPAVPRCTQVVLPASPDAEVPEWFFERTGAEVREQWAAMVRRREEQQRFMTRTMREVHRQQKEAEAAGASGAPGGGGGAPANVATVRVRFPEGACLQGQFGAGEPVSRVFQWVASSLRSPALTFELIKPDRKPLETAAPATAVASRPAAAAGSGRGPMVPLTVRAADMLPSILLNLRPVGQEAAALAAANVPLLSDELLRATKPM